MQTCRPLTSGQRFLSRALSRVLSGQGCVLHRCCTKSNEERPSGGEKLILARDNTCIKYEVLSQCDNHIYVFRSACRP